MSGSTPVTNAPKSADAQAGQVEFSVPAQHVAWIALNRPSRLNAYTPSLCRELLAALERYRQDDELRVLILTGNGRGFCAGGDIKMDGENEFTSYKGLQYGNGRALHESMHAVVRALDGLDKPVIARINGPAVSGGLMLALSCDYRIAAVSARLGDASANVALLPDEGGAWMFPRAMGRDHALRMMWLGELYSAREAKALGLVSEVVADDALDERVMDLAVALAAKAPLTVRMTKQLVQHGATTGLDSALRAAAQAVEIVNPTADVHEGLRAFGARETPMFKGQ